jgi:hypothetical protein
MTRSQAWKRLGWLTLFGVAFGYLEGAVVVYLRELYYPHGFGFPLALPITRVLGVELGRELATLVMLGSVAHLAGRNFWERFGVFAFLFGIWDLVYYIVLWRVLAWPESLFTWDILFLLPLVWSGPVISAVLVAVSLIVAGAMLLGATVPRSPSPDRWAWTGATLSILLLLGSFMANHRAVRAGTQPNGFPWIPYGIGLVLGWISFLRALSVNAKQRRLEPMTLRSE